MSISPDEFALSAAAPAPKKSRSAKQPDPITLAAESLVRVLEQQRDAGTHWLPQSQLIALLPGLSVETAEAAMKKGPAKGRLVVAQHGHSDSLWLLKEHLEPLARDASFLRSLVTAATAPAAPVILLADLTKPLDKSLKKLVDTYWPMNVERLPSGLAAMSVRSGKKSLFAIHDTRFTLPEVQLSQHLVAALRSLRDAAGENYPASWTTLLESAGPSESDDLVRRATLADPFATQVRQITVDGQTLVILADDVSSIVCSDAFLQRMVRDICNPSAPEIKLTALARKLPKDLQQPFAEHWLTMLDRDQQLEFALLQPAGTAKKRDVLIRDRRFPPPELALAESFIKTLQQQKQLGGGAYPTPWQRLLALTGTTSSTIRDKAVKTERFRSQVICSLDGEPDAPLALAGDEALLAGSPELIVTLVKKLRTDDNQLVPIDKLTRLKGIHPAVKTMLPEVLEQKVLTKSLPGGVGALMVGKKSSLFLLADVVGIDRDSPNLGAAMPPATHASATSPAPTFAHDQFSQDFDKAFATLDGKLGLPNYASLVDLRPLLSQYPRDVFDHELLKLRRAGQYSLSLVEGRFGLSDEERAACLIVDHVPHLLVQKKK